MTWFNRVRSNYKEAQEGKSFSFPFTIIIGLGFFTTAITWSMYNIYIPTYLDEYLFANWGELAYASTIIGFIMVLDNIAAVLMQPWIGHISDSVWVKYAPQKWGRRMPFIVVGIPLGAAFFTMLGVFGYDAFSGNPMTGFILLLLTIGGFNISMALYRSPVVALMPDLVPKTYRSRANGLINLMGGVGALIGLFVVPIIYKVNPLLSYIVISVLMLLCLVVLLISIQEPKIREEVDEKEKINIIPALREFFGQKDKSMMFILFAIFSWFLGYNIIETFFSLYGVKILNIAKEDASTILGVLALMFILSSVPAGYVAKKIGRRNTILVGLAIIIVSLTIASIVSVIDIPQLQSRTTFLGMDVPNTAFVIIGCFFFSGIGWAFVNINSIVIVWTLAGKNRTGMGTGVYYFFSASAAIIGPLLIGGIFDLIKYAFNLEAGQQYQTLFFFSTFFFLISAILTFFVKTTGIEGEITE
ncbi:MAG: MFS transporter [Candidatus Heimdallarchaeaceae archaeon]